MKIKLLHKTKQHHNLVRISIFFVFLASLFLRTQSVTYAQDNFSGLELSPVYQDIILNENQDSVQTKITLKNLNDTPQQVELFAYDFKQSDHFGSIALVDGFTGEYEYTLAPFLSFETNSLVIEPGKSETVTITVTNRQSLSPGGHYAAVVVRNITPQIAQQQKIVPAISGLLLVRKTGGEIFNLSIRDISWNPAISLTLPKEIELQFENNGNVHDIPRGSVQITDMFNRVVAQAIINENSSYVLPGNVRTIPINIQKSRTVFPLQVLTLNISGNSQIGKVPINAETSFLYINYKFLIFAMILGATVAVIFVKKRIKTTRKDEQKN